MRRNTLSKISIIIGLILLIGAVSLAFYNVWMDYQAGRKSKEILKEIVDKIGAADDSTDLETSTLTIDGRRYMGILNLEPLGIELPIMNSYSESNMKIAPVRYKGSIQSNDLIIAGHAYVSHFKNIDNLKKGEKISFTDISGNVFQYEVIKTEMIDQNDVPKMLSGDWDLTLYTCNFDNTKRITVRLKRV